MTKQLLYDNPESVPMTHQIVRVERIGHELHVAMVIQAMNNTWVACKRLLILN